MVLAAVPAGRAQDVKLEASQAQVAAPLRLETSTAGTFITDFDPNGQRAVWTANFPTAGDYEAWVTYAFPGNEGGGTGELTVGKSKILFATRPTQSWADYSEVNIGPVSIPNAGALEVGFRCRARTGSAFMRVKGLRFSPASASQPSAPAAGSPTGSPGGAVLKVGADGTLTLPISAAVLSGGTPVPDVDRARNSTHLGRWTNLQGEVSWNIESPAARTFTLHLAGASPAPQFGGQVELRVNHKPVGVATIPPTRDRATFAWFAAGNLPLPAGRSVVSLKAAKISGELLIDLSKARLTPPGAKPEPEPPVVAPPPLPQKRTIGPEIDGSVTLPVNDAEIVAKGLRLAPPEGSVPGRLTDWTLPGDTATWRINLPSARTLDLKLHLAPWATGDLGEFELLVDGKPVGRWVPTVTLNPTVFSWVSAGQVAVPAGKSTVGLRAVRLAGKTPLPIAAARLTSAAAPLSKVENGQLVTTRNINEPLRDGTFRLDASDAELDGGTLRLDFFDAIQHIGGWTDPQSAVQWPVRLRKTGTYVVEARFACDPSWSGSRIQISLGGVSMETSITATGGQTTFSQLGIGRLPNVPAGDTIFRISVVNKPGASVMNLRSIKLIPPP